MLTLDEPERYDSPMLRSAYLLITIASVLLASACGDVNVRDGTTAGYRTCEDITGQFHFKVLVPPWKYNKEYRCSNWTDGQCVGTWTATGRYVFVVSDVPFVNFDSEIITSLDVEMTTGDTAALVQQLIDDEDFGTTGATSTFVGEAADYPRAIEADGEGSLAGHELLWRQNRAFQGKTYNWFRRDVFLQGIAGKRYHLRFFSIDALDGVEFDALIRTFREGASDDGAPDCRCRDEHDTTGVQEC